MKENIKIGLLAVIAGTSLYNTVNSTQRASAGGHADVMEEAPALSSNKLAANAATPSTFDPLGQTTEAVDDKPKTTIKFDEYDHSFGEIMQDSENKYVFRFTNTGTEPLIIESATGSCGCTVPDYPKAPIAPGGKGEIAVVYKPGKQENQQNKTVTVVANTEPKSTTLRISANVKKVG
jgi:Protein of unknown function (DUF1573)